MNLRDREPPTRNFVNLKIARSLWAAPLLAALWLTGPTSFAAENPPGAALTIAGIHNAFRVTDNIYSGSQPEGDAAFAALAKLGVKTIISVDGSQPDLAAARKFGLRYLHLPFGYDGVPTNRVAELAKAAASAPGPFFVHCHHGLHRGPTAVAIMCEATEGWTTNRAAEWMREAGTGAEYAGLYRSAATFVKPSSAQLAAIKELPELTKPTSLVEAMVAVDEQLSALKAAQKTGWKPASGGGETSPVHAATILWEHFRELNRTDETARRPAEFRTLLGKSEQAASALREALQSPADIPRIEASFKQIGPSCAACHKTYRNQ